MANMDSFPHASGLLTPRDDLAVRDPGIVRIPLLDAQHIRTAGAEYDSLGSEASFDDLVGAARSVAVVVRNTLRFRPLAPGEEISPESLHANPATNCHGYSIVMSESLQSENIPHYVSFANEHSFLLLLDEGQGGKNEPRRSYALQGADRYLYAETTAALSGKDPVEQLESGSKFAQNGFYSAEFLNSAGKVLDDDIAKRHDWLSFRKEGATRFLETEGQIRQLDKIQIRTYPAAIGREVLSNYATVRAAVGRKRASRDDLERATESMTSLDGVFPEMDPRNKFWIPTRLRGMLLQRQMTKEAVDVARAFDNSRVWDDEAALFLPDTLRAVGKVACDGAIIDDAIERYKDLQDKFFDPSLRRRARDKATAARKEQYIIRQN